MSCFLPLQVLFNSSHEGLGWVGDGKGNSVMHLMEDKEWIENLYSFFSPNFPKDTAYNNIVIKFREGDLGKYLASRKLYGFFTVLGKHLGTI